MKRFDDLSNEEIFALTDEQINYYVDVECAYAGAPLLPPEPGTKPAKPEIEPDMVLYAVGGGYTYVATEAEAAILMEAYKKVRTWGYDYRGNIKIAQPKSDDSYDKRTDVAKMFSPELYDKHKKDLEAYEAKLKEWENVNNEYTKAVKQRTEVTDWIYEKLSNVRDLHRKREQLVAAHKQYLELAGGSNEIALNFLKKAYPNWNDADLNFEQYLQAA